VDGAGRDCFRGLLTNSLQILPRVEAGRTQDRQ
jgi:hypothetical protein